MSRFENKSLSRRALEHRLYKLLASHEWLGGLGGNALCLDVGGVGRYRAWLPSPRLLTLDLNGQHRPHVIGRAEHLPFRDDSIDLVISTELLEHCPEPAAFAAEVHRVLRPGGVLVLTTPFIFVVHGWPHDYFRYTAEGLRHLFRVFGEVEVTSYGNRFIVAYDLVVGFAPVFSSLVNGLLDPVCRDSTSSVCPAGHLLAARKT